MYVETSKATYKGKTSYHVSLRASYRVKGRIRKKTIERFGSAPFGPELERLQASAAQRKRELKHGNQPTSHGFLNDLMTMAVAMREAPAVTGLIDDFGALHRIGDVPVGVFEVFGQLFDELKLGRVLRHHRSQVIEMFRYAVLMRLLHPSASKFATSRMLEARSDTEPSVQQFNRMMDAFSPECIQVLEERIGKTSLATLGHDQNGVYITVTTLLIRSEVPGSQGDVSEEHRPDNSQVVLALLQTTDGLPLTYQTFPSNTLDVSTLTPLFQQWQQEFHVSQALVVADANMEGEANLNALTKAGFDWVVAARLHNLPRTDKQQIATWDRRDPWLDTYLEGRRLAVHWDVDHATRDTTKQERNFDRNKVHLNHQLEGMYGVWTNLPKSINAKEVLATHRELGQIEANFRVLEQDLLIRPLNHNTPQRSEAHVAMCFAAFGLRRLLMARLKECPEIKSDAHLSEILAGCDVDALQHRISGDRYFIGKRMTPAAKAIYAAVNLEPREQTVKLPRQRVENDDLGLP